MYHDEIDIETLITAAKSVMNECYSFYNIESEKRESILNVIKVVANSYRYGYHYIFPNNTSEKNFELLKQIMTKVAAENYLKLLSLTNNLDNFTSIPLKDGVTETNTVNGGTFSMSENSPIDASENITTPYIKVKGSNNHTITKNISHDTVNEYKTRQDMTTGAYTSVYDFVDTFIRSVILEYNMGY